MDIDRTVLSGEFPNFDPDDQSSNPSTNTPLRDVLAARVSRRGLMQGGTVVAAAGFLGLAGGALSDARPAAAVPGAKNGWPHGGSGPLLGFASVPVSTADALSVAPGYTAEVLIPWGTPLHSTGPAWRKDASNTAAEQAEQVGMHHDGMHFFPLDEGRQASRRGVLVVNHEYTDNTILYPDGNAVITQEKVNKALAAHGVSVVEIANVGGTWQRVDSPRNRRITGTTPVTFSGPVPAGHPKLQSNNAPMGTLNNCSHGVTPWGTYIACEENWNGYFGTADSVMDADRGAEPLRSQQGRIWLPLARGRPAVRHRGEPQRGQPVRLDG